MDPVDGCKNRVSPLELDVSGEFSIPLTAIDKVEISVYKEDKASLTLLAIIVPAIILVGYSIGIDDLFNSSVW